MARMKSLYQDLKENGYLVEDYEYAMWEYEQLIKDEETLTDEEYKAQQLYMEGKLCGEQESTARTDTSTNLSNGQKKGFPILRKPRSRK